MICKICGGITEFQNALIEQKQLDIAKEHDFTLTGHLMQLYGICAECSKKGNK